MRNFLLLISLLFCQAMWAQQGAGLKGTIVSADGQPVPYANVIVKNSRMATHTGEDGAFVLPNLSEGTHILIVSYAGLAAQEKQVVIKPGKAARVEFTLSQNSAQLDEVVINSSRSQNVRPVSAGKAPISPMDLPQSIAVIGQGVIRDQQAQRLSDVVKNVNGVYLSTTRGSTQESFSARGYSFSSGNLFKNGSRINAGAMPEMSSLERVEVLKGSSAILFGNVAPGGIINMVTKQPKFNFGGEVSLRAGSYGLLKPAFDVYGPLSSKVAYRVNGTYENAGSYRNQVSSERMYINPSFLFKVGKNTDLILQGDYLKHEFTPDFGIGSLLTSPNMIPGVPRTAFYGTDWQYNIAQQSTATATLKHKFNDSWNLTVNGSYQQYDRDYYSTERIQADPNGDWVRPLNKILSTENYFIGQVDLTGKFKMGKLEHTLLAGADADRYFTTSYTFNNPTTYDKINLFDPAKFVQRTDIPVAAKVTQVQTPVNRAGAYVQDLVSITPALKLLAGVRFSYQEALSATTRYYAKDSLAQGASKADRAFSPRVGLVYKPFDGTSLFASYANSFTVNSGMDVNNNALAPSIIDQYELGVKNDFLEGKLSVNVTAYRILNHNLAQTAQFLADGVTPNNNTNIKALVGETTSDGIELDVSSRPVEELNIIMGYSYNNMRYTRIPQVKGNYIEGERLVNTPAHTANASAFYTFSKSAVKGLKLGVSVFYIGDRISGWNNTVGQTQTYSRQIPVSGFTTIDLSAGYTYRKFSMLAKVSNVTNTYNYYVHENYSVNPIPPVQLTGTVAYRF